MIVIDPRSGVMRGGPGALGMKLEQESLEAKRDPRGMRTINGVRHANPRVEDRGSIVVMVMRIGRGTKITHEWTSMSLHTMIKMGTTLDNDLVDMIMTTEAIGVMRIETETGVEETRTVTIETVVTIGTEGGITVVLGGMRRITPVTAVGLGLAHGHDPVIGNDIERDHQTKQRPKKARFQRTKDRRRQNPSLPSPYQSQFPHISLSRSRIAQQSEYPI
jgi:hypothetical protein